MCSSILLHVGSIHDWHVVARSATSFSWLSSAQAKCAKFHAPDLLDLVVFFECPSWEGIQLSKSILLWYGQASHNDHTLALVHLSFSVCLHWKSRTLNLYHSCCFAPCLMWIEQPPSRCGWKLEGGKVKDLYWGRSPWHVHIAHYQDYQETDEPADLIPFATVPSKLHKCISEGATAHSAHQEDSWNLYKSLSHFHQIPFALDKACAIVNESKEH